MLEVICVNDSGTKKVIKGQKYIADAMWEERGWNNNIKPSIWHNGILVLRRRVRIRGINSYFVDRFKTVDGSNFYDIEEFGDKYEQNYNAVEPNNKDYTNEYVKCRYDKNSKNLKQGEIYLVEEHRKEVVNSIYTCHYFKLKGLRNQFNTHGFEDIPLREQRKLKLKSINGEKIVAGLQKRKFLYFTNFEKTRIVLELYLEAFTNLKNIQELDGINIVDVMVKAGSKYDIRKEDITPLFNKSLNKIAKELKFL